MYLEISQCRESLQTTLSKLRNNNNALPQAVAKHLGSAIIIHLQRYHSPNPDACVTVPKRLNMSRYIQGAGVYSLCSAIYHRDTELNGHYTCYAKTSNGWMHFDDPSTSTTSSGTCTELPTCCQDLYQNSYEIEFT